MYIWDSQQNYSVVYLFLFSTIFFINSRLEILLKNVDKDIITHCLSISVNLKILLYLESLIILQQIYCTLPTQSNMIISNVILQFLLRKIPIATSFTVRNSIHRRISLTQQSIFSEIFNSQNTFEIVFNYLSLSLSLLYSIYMYIKKKERKEKSYKSLRNKIH